MINFSALFLLLAQSIVYPCHGFVPLFPTTANNAKIQQKIQPSNRSPKSSSLLTSLHLLSVNLNLGNNQKDDDDDDDEKKKEANRPATNNAKEEAELVDSDFSSWVEGLRQWPLYPSMERTIVTDNDPASFSSSTDKPLTSSSSSSSSSPSRTSSSPTSQREMSVWSSSRYRGSNPLSNFINFEALLEAAVSSSTDATTTSTKSSKATSGASSTTNATTQSESSPSTFPNIFAITEQLLRMSSVSAKNDDKATKKLQEEATSNLSNISTVEEFIAFEKWMETISKTVMMGGGGNPNAATAEKALSKAVAAATAASKPESMVPLPSNMTALSSTSPAGGVPTSFSAEAIVKEATARIEYLVNASSVALSPSRFQNLILQANRALSWTSVDSATENVLQAAEQAAQDRGLDVKQVKDRARETTRFAADIVTVANSLFGAGFAYGAEPAASVSATSTTSAVDSYSSSAAATVASTPDSKPLFAEFKSARTIPSSLYGPVVAKAAELGPLAGTIYEEGMERFQGLGHALVANGTTADVAWMVTDSIGYERDFIVESQPSKRSSGDAPLLIRTITIRGFDASDETVDRERLLNIICMAAGEPISNETAATPTSGANPSSSKVLFHKGLLSTAREIYEDVKKYIDYASPNHRIVLNGHSIGGSLSILLLLLLTEELGAEVVKKKVLRAFALGSPPIAAMTEPPVGATKNGLARNVMSMDARPLYDDDYRCDVLEAFGLPSSMVYGYIQPWDPIVRFLTEYDALYPLVDDLGDDGITLYSTGPPRSLRPITRAIIQSWDGWPQFRDSWKGTNQKYRSVGIQHLLLPEPLRYLNDRFVSTNIGVPDTDSVVRISSRELLPALEATFPMDVFQISFVPQAVRSFLHHFYPAYDFTISDFSQKLLKKNEEARVSSEKKAKKRQTPFPKPDIVNVEGLRNETTTAEGQSARGWARTR